MFKFANGVVYNSDGTRCTDAELNAAVAKECGWKRHVPPKGAVSTGEWEYPKGGYTSRIPDYVSDLNACVEMEACLNRAERLEYSVALVYILYKCGFAYDLRIIANSRQRVIAFLKTKNRLELHDLRDSQRRPL